MFVEIFRKVINKSVFGDPRIPDQQLANSPGIDKKLLVFARGLLGTRLSDFEIYCAELGTGISVGANTLLSTNIGLAFLGVSIVKTRGEFVDQEADLGFDGKKWSMRVDIGPRVAREIEVFRNLASYHGGSHRGMSTEALISDQYLEVGGRVVGLTHMRAQTNMSPGMAKQLMEGTQRTAHPVRKWFQLPPQRWDLAPHLIVELEDE